MKSLFQDFVAFLSEYWWVWLAVIVLFAGVLVYFAKQGGAPDAPFQYRF